MSCSIIVAYSKNWIIGQDAKIPWNIPSERDRFKVLCNGKKIIMGRKTFEEIGHALPYCTIIVVSKTLKKVPQGCFLVDSLEKAFILSGEEIIIAGGGEIYKKTLNMADTIYATKVNIKLQKTSATSFFPKIPRSKFKCVSSHKVKYNPSYKYLTYKRR